MKNNVLKHSIVFFLVFYLQSCRTDCDQRVYFTTQTPIYNSLSKIRKSIESADPKEIISVDQIVATTNAFFLLERNQGIHVLERVTENSLKKLSFIKAQACLEVSQRFGFLIVCQGPDIVTLDITNLSQIREVSRLENVMNMSYIKSDSFISYYENREVEKVLPDDCVEDEIKYVNVEDLANPLKPHASNSALNNNIYACDNDRLVNVQIDSQSGDLQLIKNINLGSNRFRDASNINNGKYLVIGHADNVLIPFSLRNSNGTPELSTFAVQPSNTCGNTYLINDYLFYTGSPENIANRSCNGKNYLFIRNFGSGSAGFHKAHIFTQPFHLSTQKNTSLLSDGAGGIHLLDVSNPASFELTKDVLGSYKQINAQKSLYIGDIALVWGNEGLFLLDLSNPSNIVLLSKIE